LPSQKGQLGGKTDTTAPHQATSRILQEKRAFWQLEKAFILPVDIFSSGLFWAQDIQPKEFSRRCRMAEADHMGHFFQFHYTVFSSSHIITTSKC